MNQKDSTVVVVASDAFVLADDLAYLRERVPVIAVTHGGLPIPPWAEVVTRDLAEAVAFASTVGRTRIVLLGFAGEPFVVTVHRRRALREIVGWSPRPEAVQAFEVVP